MKVQNLGIIYGIISLVVAVLVVIVNLVVLQSALVTVIGIILAALGVFQIVFSLRIRKKIKDQSEN